MMCSEFALYKCSFIIIKNSIPIYTGHIVPFLKEIHLNCSVLSHPLKVNILN